MAVATKYDVTYKCGHSQIRDLSKTPAGKRAGFAQWLHTQPCFNCSDRENKEQRRVQRIQDAERFTQRLDLPPLNGTERQLMWAPIFRHELIDAAHSFLVTEAPAEAALTEEEFESRILDYARRLTRAGWWMSNSKTDAEDFEELITTAQDEDDEGIEENPF
jgi:hypothetical protein